jgi:choline dehydrogenase
LFSDRRAMGVAYLRGGEERKVYAAREVILAGGPINSPQLLKLSGVGPAGELRALGIEVAQELRGVGENLQDHLEFYFQVECREPITLYSAMSPLAKAWIGMRWLLRHDGPGATNHFETGGFIRSRAGMQYPDLQYHFLPLAVSYDGKSLAPGHGFQAHIGPMRSPRRGWVRLASADPAEAPRIRFNLHERPR